MSAGTHLKEWFTLTELLPHAGKALPASLSKLTEHVERAGWRNDKRCCRMRWGRGGGAEFHYTLFPAEVRAKLILAQAPTPPGIAEADGHSSAVWAAFERASPGARLEAKARLAAIDAVEALPGMTRVAAVAQVASLHGIGPRTLFDWLGLVDRVHRADRLPALLPRHVGRTATAACDPRAWEALKADYLRPEQRCFEVAYRYMVEVAAAEGWSPIPSAKTLKRRLEREIPATVRELARNGEEAVRRMYPAQRRDRSGFRALEAVNADGHKLDLLVKWEDGSIGRPILTVFQDLYSGAILSCRVDRSENREVVRLALADLVECWGVPEQCWLDNGRHFASKWISGGQSTRYRFKRLYEEPDGILKALGVLVHFTQPYSGQSKPIERAFLDFCENIAKHPVFAGAYTGNSTVTKPANYGSHAVPLSEFETVLAAEIHAHNIRKGRRTLVCGGKRSFLEALEESVSRADLPPRRATAEQRRMLLLAAESVTARAPDGALHLLGNRYHDDALHDHIGARLTVRLDPQNLAAPVAVYTADNRFICEAAPIGDVLFGDSEAARVHGNDRRAWVKHQKALLDLDRRLSIDDLAALGPLVAPPQPPERQTVRLVANGRPQRSIEPDTFRPGQALLGEVVAFRKENGGL